MSLGISSDLNTNYKQCSRCVMDTSDTEIVFDDEIFCNHCNSHLLQMEKIKNGKDTVTAHLKRKILEIKEGGKNNKYDCIVGVSGGADGCYSAYLCKQYGLRALLVHMDNGWNSTIAVENIKVVADKLQFDYESFVLDWVEFKDLQLPFFIYLTMLIMIAKKRLKF